jgi:hypothetical protein
MARDVLGADSTLIVDQLCVLDTETACARETAGRRCGARGCTANFARMGFGDTDVSELSDRNLDDLVVWDDVEAIVTRITEHLDAGAGQVVLGEPNDRVEPGHIQVARRLAGRLLH